MSLILVCFLGTMVHADPRADLASPSQSERDKAAANIQKTYKASPQAQWSKALAAVTVGDSYQKVVKELQPFHGEIVLAGGDLGMEGIYYQLDDTWALICTFEDKKNTTKPGKLMMVRLVQHIRTVDVEPAPKFTGLWTTYYANGVKRLSAHFKNGTPAGEQIFYNSDGSIESRINL